MLGVHDGATGFKVGAVEGAPDGVIVGMFEGLVVVNTGRVITYPPPRSNP
jgi:hypothetical protein